MYYLARLKKTLAFKKIVEDHTRRQINDLLPLLYQESRYLDFDKQEAEALWECLTFLYWETDAHVADIAEAFRMPPDYVSECADPQEIEARCQRCKQIKQTYRETRSDSKNPRRFTCDECKNSHYAENERARLQQERRQDELATMPYREYLQTPEWKARRAEHLRSAKYKCQLCNRGGQLHVHHRTYENRGNERWSDLLVLCADCHAKHHDI